jgi:hypothetical protein
MQGSCLLRIECDENKCECPNTVHTAILPAMRE